MMESRVRLTSFMAVPLMVGELKPEYEIAELKMAAVGRRHGGDCRGGPSGGGPPDDRWLPVYGCQTSGCMANFLYYCVYLILITCILICLPGFVVPKRGRTRNKGLEETIKKTETDILPIDFEKEDKMYVAVGPNRESFNTLVGTIVSRIPSWYESWNKVPAAYRTTIIPEIRTYFDMTPHLEGPDSKSITNGIFTYCQRRYRDQKNKFKTDWFENRGGIKFVEDLRRMPPPNIDDEDWNKFLNRMASPEFQKRSAKAKESRAKQKIEVHQGRKSMVQNRYANRDPITKELPSQIEEYRRLRSRCGKFTSKEAAAYYAQMIALKEAQADVSDPMSDNSIMAGVLRPRRVWKRGIGRQLPQSDASSSCTSQSTQRLFKQDEVSQMMAQMRAEIRTEMMSHTAPLFKAMTSQGLLPQNEDQDEGGEDEVGEDEGSEDEGSSDEGGDDDGGDDDGDDTE